jgi:nucleolar MIF4G domain-containing protein 1
LNDILTASTKGKWWIVGAAWAGDPVRERERERARQAALKQASEGKQTGSKREADEDEDDETDLIGLGVGQQDELLRLARKQGMNTDVRRQVFMVMMTSDVS